MVWTDHRDLRDTAVAVVAVGDSSWNRGQGLTGRALEAKEGGKGGGARGGKGMAADEGEHTADRGSLVIKRDGENQSVLSLGESIPTVVSVAKVEDEEGDNYRRNGERQRGDFV